MYQNRTLQFRVINNCSICFDLYFYSRKIRKKTFEPYEIWILHHPEQNLTMHFLLSRTHLIDSVVNHPIPIKWIAYPAVIVIFSKHYCFSEIFSTKPYLLFLRWYQRTCICLSVCCDVHGLRVPLCREPASKPTAGEYLFVLLDNASSWSRKKSPFRWNVWAICVLLVIQITFGTLECGVSAVWESIGISKSQRNFLRRVGFVYCGGNFTLCPF